MSQLLNSHVVPSLGLAAGARVVVAMSGGVDSSVVAALLVHQGYDVIGITLQLYDHGAATARKGACCAGQDIHDARRVAERLGIPHYVLDYEQRFADRVIGAFADAYAAGETPVPCITCNQQIKFTDLLETARDLGAAALATGHYVAREDGPGGPWLRRAVDADRDQSYFLFGTTREQLAMLRFPLGHLTKARVRDLAAELALPVATKPDSQDICFVPSGHYSALIERLRPSACEPGDIVHIDGRVLGRHDGVIRYTVGQRRGLGLSGHHSSVQTGGQASAGPDGSIEPLFVVRLDAARRRVIVGPRSALRTRAIILKNMNWLGGDTPGTNAPTLGEGLECFARVRSTQAPRPARLWLGRMRDDRQPSSRKFGDATPTVEAHVELLGVEHGVSPGQACVLYADGTAEARLLGGGIIAATDVSIALAPLRA